MSELKVLYSGSWRAITQPEVKISGAWQDVQEIEVKVGGAWQTVFMNLSVVVAPTKTIGKTSEEPTDAYAGCKVDNDGDLYESETTSSTYNWVSYETWLDGGAPSMVWVQRVIVSGTFDLDAGSGRLACTTDRIFRVQVTGTGTKQCVFDLHFYDAASGGNHLDTQRVTLTAHVDEFTP